jgi:hypothetical protein
MSAQQDPIGPQAADPRAVPTPSSTARRAGDRHHSRRSLLRAVLTELPRVRAGGTPSTRGRSDGGVTRRWAVRPMPAARSHQDAVVAAEVRLLVERLMPFGVLHRDELARRVGADLWRSGTFEEALAAGVRGGALRVLGRGSFVAIARPRALEQQVAAGFADGDGAA